jgi:hypothetical protein
MKMESRADSRDASRVDGAVATIEEELNIFIFHSARQHRFYQSDFLLRDAPSLHRGTMLFGLVSVDTTIESVYKSLYEEMKYSPVTFRVQRKRLGWISESVIRHFFQDQEWGLR